MTSPDALVAQLMESKTCGWERGGLLMPVARCEQTADRALVLGCVHEHLTPPLPTCSQCAEDFMLALAKGDMLCTPCAQHGSETLIVLVRVDEL